MVIKDHTKDAYESYTELDFHMLTTYYTWSSMTKTKKK